MFQSTFDLNGKDQTPVIACGELPQQRFETGVGEEFNQVRAGFRFLLAVLATVVFPDRGN